MDLRRHITQNENGAHFVGRKGERSTIQGRGNKKGGIFGIRIAGLKESD